MAALPVAAVKAGPADSEGRVSLAAGCAVYGLLLAGALLWLWLRERFDALPEAAVGTHGPWIASGTGLAIGCLGAWALRLASPRVRSIAELENQARLLFERAGEGATLAFLLTGVVAEEVFFRLAVQDALGLAGSVAVYSLLHGSLAGAVWIPITALHALVLGLLVQQGFGLLGSATAHAIMNHLTLRRILCA